MPMTFPEPDLYTPGHGEPALRWGVLAPGRIASSFVGAVLEHTQQRVVAAASRSIERAEEFCARTGVERAYGSYEQLVEDPEIDVVYIAAPQSEHLALGLLALRAGKNTVIEKPLATNAADARTLVSQAHDAGVFLMEAMWSRYHPKTSVIRRLIAEGALGEVRSVVADFGHAVPADVAHRLYRPELGGGALLDLGIYPVQFSSMVAGRPASITAVGGLTTTGVDAYSTSILQHASGVQSTLTTTLLTRTPSRAYIAGTSAHIELDGPFHVPGGFSLGTNDPRSVPERWEDPTGLAMFAGLSWEATAAARFIGEGRTESPVHTLDETVAILETTDEVLRQLHAANAG
ncbi:Gfo/Idh/MocA family oxidoreductase [Okibacterium endophyticum]